MAAIKKSSPVEIPASPKEALELLVNTLLKPPTFVSRECVVVIRVPVEELSDDDGIIERALDDIRGYGEARGYSRVVVPKDQPGWQQDI